MSQSTQHPMKPRLVIIDDNIGFLEATKKELDTNFQLTTILVDTINYKTIVERVIQARPDYLLLDITLNQPGQSHETLRALAESKALKGCTVRLISFGLGVYQGKQYDSESAQDADRWQEKTLQEFQAISARVKGPLIRKPISAYTLQAALLGTAYYSPNKDWEQFPLPLRVLDASGSVLFANKMWRSVNSFQPDPVLFQDWHSVWQQSGTCPVPLDYLGNPFQIGSSSYKVHSFPIEQDGLVFLGQVIESSYFDIEGSSLDTVIRKVFEVMQLVGFNYGQCFILWPLAGHVASTVPYVSSDDEEYKSVELIAELKYLSENYPQTLKNCLPLVRPLRGVLRSRIEDFQKDFSSNVANSNGKLLFSIRKAADDKLIEDTDIQWWRKKLGQNHPELRVDSWLEVPVLASKGDLQYPPIDGPDYQVIAVLMFSRARENPKNSGTSVLFDTGTGVNEDDHINPIKPLLLTLIKNLYLSLKELAPKKFIEIQKDIHEYDEKIYKIKNIGEKKQLLLECLGNAIEADHTFFITPHRSQNYLQLDGSWSKPPKDIKHIDNEAELPDVIKAVSIPLDSKKFSAAKAWNEQSAYYHQHIIESMYLGQIKEGFQSDLVHKSGESNKWISWLERHVGSALVFPVIVNEKTIGLIVAYFKGSWSILAHTIETVDVIAHRARWILQSDTEEKERNNWQLVLGHEMRTDLYAASNALLEILKHTEQMPLMAKYWLRLKRGLTSSTDLAENWLSLLRSVETGTPGDPFTALSAIDFYIQIYQEELDNDRALIDWKLSRNDPTWMASLVGYQEWYNRIIRVVLDNARKFGRNYMDSLDKSNYVPNPFTIDIYAYISSDKRQFVVRISNPGHMTDSEYRYRFDAKKVPAQRKTDGAHVGLSAAERLTDTVGGYISLENDTVSEQVVSELSWPLDMGNSK